MKLLVTGSHGLVGSALLPSLSHGGHDVVRLIRSQPSPGRSEVHWDPASNSIDRASLNGLDGVIHLAGENLASGRWSAARKGRIRASRVQGTHLLSETLAELASPPRILLSASAVGFYGSRGGEVLTESSPAGEGFLAEVCKEWEAATATAAEAGIRVVNLRFGVILSQTGGALRKMLPVFRLGLGGPLSDGAQFWSWISLDDVIAALHHALRQDDLVGPVNITSPCPVTNREFTSTLGHVLGRPTILPVPAFLLRIGLGQMADETLLASTRVHPEKLLASGFLFKKPELSAALRSLLG